MSRTADCRGYLGGQTEHPKSYGGQLFMIPGRRTWNDFLAAWEYGRRKSGQRGHSKSIHLLHRSTEQRASLFSVRLRDDTNTEDCRLPVLFHSIYTADAQSHQDFGQEHT